MRIVAPLVLGLVGLAAWQLIVLAGGIPVSILPPPTGVLARLGQELRTGDLLTRTAITIWEAILGCVLAVCIGLPTGYLVGRHKLADIAVSPYLAASQAIPAVAVAPLLVIWVGYGLTPIVLLCALLVFFPVVLATRLGLHSMDKDVLEAAQLDGASGWQRLTHIEWPLALPTVLTGVRNGFTLSVTGAVVGELVMGGQGLGMVLSAFSATTDTTGLFATLVVLCALAVAIYLAILGVEKATDPFAPTQTRTRSVIGSSGDEFDRARREG